ncbi:MAG: sigma-70 family RNA polymerase sigma factor [Bacteroidales bacterium]|nr:sigma-70 family RNA polymerase sigma factor [Bacteroidales bacterium]
MKKNKRYTIWNNAVDEDYCTPSLDEDLINAEKVKELHSAINKLKYEQKVAPTLHCFDDMSYKEVAEVWMLVCRRWKRLYSGPKRI